MSKVPWYAPLTLVAELCVYASTVMAGWRLHPALGIAAGVFMSLWWGSFHAPKAAVQLPSIIEIPLRLTWFCVGAAALRLVVA